MMRDDIKELRSKCGLETAPIANPAIKRSLDAMVNRSFNRAKAELILRSETLTTEIRMLGLLVVLLGLVSGLLAVMHVYVAATVAMGLTLIPSTMLLTRYDRREMIRRKLAEKGGRQ